MVAFKYITMPWKDNQPSTRNNQIANEMMILRKNSILFQTKKLKKNER